MDTHDQPRPPRPNRPRPTLDGFVRSDYGHSQNRQPAQHRHPRARTAQPAYLNRQGTDPQPTVDLHTTVSAEREREREHKHWQFWRLPRRWSRRTALIATISTVAVLAIGTGTYAFIALGGGGSSSANAVNLQKGLVGWWKLDGNAKDSTPYADNGTNHSATLTTDRHGAANTAYAFDGASNYIALPDNAYNSLSSGTISIWVNMTARPAAGGAQVLVANGSSSASSNLFGISLYGLTSSDTRFRVGSNSPISNYVYGNTSITPGTWYNLVLVSNGSAWSLYVNGSLQSLTVQQGSNTGYFFNSQVSGTMHYDIGVLNRSTGLSGYFNGTADDVRIYNRAISSTEVTALYKEYNPQLNAASGENSLAAWWKFDGNLKDATPHANDASGSAGSYTTDREGTANSAYNFTGTSYLTAANSSSLEIYNSPLSISFWMKPASASTSETVLIKGSEYTVCAGGGSLIFRDNLGDGITTSYTLQNNNWYHVAFTLNSARTQVSTYVNGNLVDGPRMEGAWGAIASTGQLTIGQGGGCSSTSYSGALDDLRIYNRTLSSNEISNLDHSYNSQISLYSGSGSGSGVNLSNGLIGEWDFTGNAKDSTPYSDNGTVNGATLTTDRFGSANSAYSVNGTSAYIGLPAFSSVTSVGDFTESVWIKVASLNTNGRNYIVDMRGDGTTTSNSFGLFIDNPSTLQVFAMYGGGSWSQYGGTIPVTLVGQWVHLAAIRSGTSFQAYVNGQPISLSLTAGVAGQNTAQSLTDKGRLGTYSGATAGGNYWFNGSIDGFRIYKRALSAAEVQALYQLSY